MPSIIYTGFRIEGHSLDSFFDELSPLKCQLTEKANKLYCQAITRLAVYWFDRRAAGLLSAYELNKASALHYAFEQFHQRQHSVRTQHAKDPLVDLSLELCLFKSSAGLLGIYFCEQSQLSVLLRSQPWFQEFGYWEHKAAPAWVSSQEWVARQQAWTQVLLSKSGVPAKDGLLYQLISSDHRYLLQTAEDFGGLAEFLPTQEQRIESLAPSLAMTRAKISPNHNQPISVVMEKMQEDGWLDAARSELAQVLAPQMSVQSLAEPALTMAWQRELLDQLSTAK